MKVLLLGAGSSSATLGDCIAPVSRTFGKTLNTRHPDWVERLPFLRSAVSYLGKPDDDWPLDAIWNGIDENYKLRRVISNDTYEWPCPPPDSKRLYQHYKYRCWSSFWVLAGWELKRAVAKVYGTALEPSMTETCLPERWLSKYMTEIAEKDVVASMNYDLLAENIIQRRWEKAGNCHTLSEIQSRKRGSVPLILKLHGSLDWQFRSNWITKEHRVDRTIGGSPIKDDEIDLDQYYWETRPLIVAPVRYKDEMVFPGAQPAELVKVLTLQWKELIEAISGADELVVLGYSFPADDSYGKRMLKEAMRRRSTSRILQVRLYLPNEPPCCECSSCRTRLQKDIFPANLANVQCCGRIPPSN